MTDTIEARVARGAEWLDENKPGWERLVDLGELEMASVCHCILGQTFTNEAVAAGVWQFEKQRRPAGFLYVAGGSNGLGKHVQSLTPEISTHITIHGIPWAEHFGFDFIADETEYEPLADCWRTLIKGRFDSGILSDHEEDA